MVGMVGDHLSDINPYSKEDCFHRSSLLSPIPNCFLVGHFFDRISPPPTSKIGMLFYALFNKSRRTRADDNL